MRWVRVASFGEVSTTIRIATIIDAPPATVWAAIEDIGSHVTWMSDAESISFRTPQRAGVGTVYDCRTKIGPIRLVDAMSITRWIPNVAMGVEHRGVVRGSGVFSLRSVGNERTRFSWEETLPFPWWFGGPVGEVFGRPVLTRLWRGNLARLKSLVEQSSAHS
jgi:carbon monoxide dehydrogenase subunit G